MCTADFKKSKQLFLISYTKLQEFMYDVVYSFEVSLKGNKRKNILLSYTKLEHF